MIMKNEDWKNFNESKICYVCNVDFNNKYKNRDHDHISG
jgi:hypothetical protein